MYMYIYIYIYICIIYVHTYAHMCIYMRAARRAVGLPLGLLREARGDDLVAILGEPGACGSRRAIS